MVTTTFGPTAAHLHRLLDYSGPSGWLRHPTSGSSRVTRLNLGWRHLLCRLEHYAPSRQESPLVLSWQTVDRRASDNGSGGVNPVILFLMDLEMVRSLPRRIVLEVTP